MENEEKNIDWQSQFLEGNIPLYEALLMYMLERRIVPSLLTEKFTEAIVDYGDGNDGEIEIGLDQHYPKSIFKRKKNDKELETFLKLKDKLELFSDIGLKKVKPENVKNKHSPETISAIKKLLLKKEANLNFQPNELEFMTAYQAVGKLYNMSEATVRKKLERYPL